MTFLDSGDRTEMWMLSIFSEQPLRQLPPTVINVVESSRKRFPLGMMHATHYVKPRMVLIG